jgi:putative tryptophan/tyrosine transport system substrate-binding protein
MGESMRQNIFCVALCALHLALGFPAAAQQPTKVPRIALLSGRVAPTPATPDANAEAFRQGQRDLGYLEGTNILVEYPYIEAKTAARRSCAPLTRCPRGSIYRRT